jgi:prepilin-type processing-associated H-X9-DG protein
MKPRLSKKRNAAMTLFEVGVVIAIVMILVVVFLPRFARSPEHSSRINCVNNLKLIALAYRIWAGDNNDKYPMQVSTTNGGTMELMADGKNVWRNFLVMSNELSTPKILFCPADAGRICATNFSNDLKDKISYFFGVDANPKDPQMLLSGDDNFAISGIPVKSGLLEISSNTPIAWTSARHKFAGNIGLADGSVQQVSNSELTNSLQPTGSATIRLAIP